MNISKKRRRKLEGPLTISGSSGRKATVLILPVKSLALLTGTRSTVKVRTCPASASNTDFQPWGRRRIRDRWKDGLPIRFSSFSFNVRKERRLARKNNASSKEVLP